MSVQPLVFLGCLPIMLRMRVNSWADRLNGRQRVVHAFATAIGLLIASAMFFSLHATNDMGARIDCGPAAYALFASSTDAELDHGYCRREAWQRMTTVSGLVALTVIGSSIGSRLAKTPPSNRPRELVYPVTAAEAPRRPQGDYPRP
jgi:hypothetical protein